MDVATHSRMDGWMPFSHLKGTFLCRKMSSCFSFFTVLLLSSKKHYFCMFESLEHSSTIFGRLFAPGVGVTFSPMLATGDLPRADKLRRSW